MKEIVIKLPDDYNVNMGAEILIDAVIDGVELSKGHGDLIDKSELTTVTEIKPDDSECTYVPYSEIENANVVVEAEKEG